MRDDVSMLEGETEGIKMATWCFDERETLDLFLINFLVNSLREELKSWRKSENNGHPNDYDPNYLTLKKVENDDD
jgi:hypothetical protein